MGKEFFGRVLKVFLEMRIALMSEIMEITDFNRPELDIFARTPEVQLARYFEPEPGIFIAESPKVIGRALDAGYEPISFLMERRHVETEGRAFLVRCEGTPVYVAELSVLTRLTGFPLTGGMLCSMRRKRLPDVKAVCKAARRVAVLENVVNPTNIGAIFRSAAALNMDAVLLSPGCTDPLYRRAVRVSMGTVFQVPWTVFPKTGWPGEGLAQLKSMGFETAAMALKENSVSIDDARLTSAKRLAILIGNEGDGLTDETIGACGYTVKIPMSHGVDSLNAGAAAAVAFWQLGR